MSRALALGMGLAGLLLTAGPALAFGTLVVPFGSHQQNREHERITRHALGCGEPDLPGLSSHLPAGECFEPNSLTALAGKRFTYGAVGAPDNVFRGLITTPTAHCDNGDYLDPALNLGRVYRHGAPQARANLMSCWIWMHDNLNRAVSDAGRLLNRDGSVNDNEIPTRISCTFLGHGGTPLARRAKCDVLEDLGLTLHASQDFYAHSNWTDHVDATRAIDRTNPPGMGQTGAAPLLDMGQTPLQAMGSVPADLITGCFVSVIAAEDGCPNEVAHTNLNKDHGLIDADGDPAGAVLDFAARFRRAAPEIGLTPRGAVGGNFRSAVLGAVEDSRSQWATLRGKLIATYGEPRGRAMICALTHDDPVRDCRTLATEGL